MWRERTRDIFRQGWPFGLAISLHVLTFAALLILPRSPQTPPPPQTLELSLESLAFEPQPPAEPPPKPVTNPLSPPEAREPPPKILTREWDNSEAGETESDTGDTDTFSDNAPPMTGAFSSLSEPSSAPTTIDGRPDEAHTQMQNTLRAFSCLRLGQTEWRPECEEFQRNGCDEIVLSKPSDDFAPSPDMPNPFETRFDRFTAGQYADTSTPYTLFQSKTNDHQHASPFASPSLSSAERDLSGRINALPDPVWGD